MMNSLKNIQPQQRVQQVNTMLRECYPNQQYQVRDEHQADAVINTFASSPHAQQFDNFLGQQSKQQSSQQQSGGSETIHNPSSQKQSASANWDDGTRRWLSSHESQIKDALK